MNRTRTPPKHVEAADPHKLDLESIAKEALAHALRRGRRLAWNSGNARIATLAVAEDAAAEAVASLFGGSRKWNPTKEPDPRQHVRSVINSLLWNRLISSEEDARPLEGRALWVADPSDPEMLLLAKQEHEWQQHILDLFTDRVLDDPELLAIYTAMERLETDKPALLAKHLNVPVRDIDSRKRKLRALMSEVFQAATKDRAKGTVVL